MNNTQENTNVVDLTSPLTIYNATEAALAEIKKNYIGLTITGVDDKDGYKAVAEGLRIVVGLRNKVDKRRQELKRHIDNGSKHILTELAPVETALRLQKDRIDNEVERIKQEKAEAERLAFVARTEELFKLGFTFNGAIYTLAHLVMTPTQVKDADDQFWSGFTEQGAKLAAELKAKADAEAAELEKLRAENARLKREEEERIAAMAAQNTIDDLKHQGAIVDGKVTGVQVDSEGVTVNADIQPHTPLQNIKVDFTDAANVSETVSAPNSGSLENREEFNAADVIFIQGFDACKKLVLEILNDTAITKRSIMIERVTNLKP